MRNILQLGAFVGLAVALEASESIFKPISRATFDPSVPSNNLPTVPGAFIVQLSSAPSKRSIDPHAEFLSELDKRATGRFKTQKKFKSSIYNAIAVQFKDPKDLVDLASIPNVISVRPVQRFSRPTPVGGGPPTPGPLDGSGPHFLTARGVDKVHKQGLDGKGIIVGIIDTGVDYLHPALGGGFGPGFKIANGWDFVGDDYDGFGDPVPDPDPRDTCAGHGSHVAGIVGANPGNEWNVTGVAPGATLYAYRIFGCLGNTDDSIIIDALLRAYNDGADVITLSLGTSSGWSESPSSVVASLIADQGRVLTIAAGNDGSSGPVVVSAPSTGVDVISVGSVINVSTLRQSLVTNHPDKGRIPYSSVMSSVNQGTMAIPFDGSIEIYNLDDHGDPTTFCDDGGLGENPPDLTDKAVFVRYTPACFFELAGQLARTNSHMVILWDAPEGQFNIADGFYWLSIPDINDANWMVEQAKAGNLTISFPQEGGAVQVPNPEGGLVSAFSSFGLTADALFKPAFVTPGANITSTWPVNLGSYNTISGTSMATPYAAGSAALVLQSKGKGAAQDVRRILQTSARAVPNSKAQDSLPETLAQQGAGLINVYQSIYGTSNVSPGELLLNDTEHWKPDHVITVKNTGKKEETYYVYHQAAGTIRSLPDEINYQPYPVELIKDSVDVHLSKTKFTLKPGQSTTVRATIAPPRGVNKKQLPIVSGWITVLAYSSRETYRVSYAGFAGSLRGAQVISTGNDFLFKGELGTPVFAMTGSSQPRFFMPITEATNYTVDDFLPTIFFSLAQPSARFILDLIDAKTDIHTNLPPTLGVPVNKTKRDWSGWYPGITRPGKGTSYASVPILGTIIESTYFPRQGKQAQSVRSSLFTTIPVVFANGTAVPNGQYKVLLRALRVNGNPDTLDDYDIFVTPQWGFI
ncbi:subtilisin-like protein [Mycena rebaudengoi]|nr:subtilisin-like protein [Mycena rebaudengoi]